MLALLRVVLALVYVALAWAAFSQPKKERKR